jgi:lipopolysaccharide transport system ATP-binding protein
MITFHKVSKTYCRDVDTSRKRAIARIIWSGIGKMQDGGEKEFYALDDISFCVKKGEHLLIAGPDNSGKSSIARIICGLAQPSAGEVKIGGRTRLVQRSKIGSTPLMSLRQYICFLATLYGADGSRVNGICQEVFEQCHLENLSKAKLHDVQDDLLKNVTYYVSLSVDSDIYVFDESLKTDDTELGQLCRKRIEEIFASRTAVVLAKTFGQGPDKLANILILQDGRVEALGSYDSMRSLYNDKRALSPYHIDSASPVDSSSSVEEDFDF